LKATVTAYAVTGLTASTAYTFCKSERCCRNVSASSNVISVTTTAPAVANYTFKEIVPQARTW
jgi:hypothetical protein